MFEEQSIADKRYWLTKMNARLAISDIYGTSLKFTTCSHTPEAGEFMLEALVQDAVIDMGKSSSTACDSNSNL